MADNSEILEELICLRKQINKVIEKIQKPRISDFQAPRVREIIAPEPKSKKKVSKKVKKYLDII